MIELFHAHISTCSQKVRLCLAEKGLSYESRAIDFARMEHLSDNYLAINPNGVVPALVHRGKPIIDSSVICEYIDEVWPEQPLSPGDPAGRANMRAWMRYIEEVPTAAIRVPSFNKLFAKSIGLLPDDAFQKMTDKMPLRKAFYHKLQGVKGFDKSLYDESIEKLASTLTRVDKALANSGSWLLGKQFSIADIVLIPTFVRMADLELDDMWQAMPRVSNWFAAVQERPSFTTAYYPGSRVNSSYFDFALPG